MENLQDRNKDREKVKDSHTLSSMWSADTLTHLILMINDCFATACDCTRSIYCVLYIFIHELFSRTCVHYLQHYLQVFHVSFLSLYQLMDVTLSLLLLGAQWVQAVQICTPCRRRGRTQEEGLYDLYRSTSAAASTKPSHYLNHSNTLALHLPPPAGQKKHGAVVDSLKCITEAFRKEEGDHKGKEEEGWKGKHERL